MTETACTNCFKSLGVPSRMAIYKYLSGSGASSVGSIVSVVELTQPTVSHHLKEMKESGMLNSYKKGKEVFYTINNECPHFHRECVLRGIDIPVIKK